MEKNYRYAIRKTTLGVGSVAIAAFLAGQGQEVQAAEQPSQPSSALAVDAVNPADQAGFYAAEGAAVNTDQPASGDAASTSGLPADTVNMPIVPASVTNPDNVNYSEDEKNVGTYRQSEMANNGITHTATEQSGKTEGVSHVVTNPSASSDDKRTYGIDISFDRNDSERTYNHVSFTDSKLNAPVRTNRTVEFENVGSSTALNGKNVDYKPTEGARIDANGPQRNINSTLSQEDLKHINNVNNKETTISFRDKYNINNLDTDKQLLNSGNFGFTFGVNPYPNENANLSLIKVAGDTNVNRVAVKEGYIKTGAHIKNLDPADYDRVVGQVYHPDGSVVKEANAFIITPKNIDEFKTKLGDDIKLGQIIFAMPKGALEDPNSIFNTEKFKGIQSLKAQFFARPRTAAEFQEAADTKNMYETGVPTMEEYKTAVAEGWDTSPFKYVETGAGTQTLNHNGKEVIADKQGIARYDNYNLLGEITVNLDDTRYYDQSFIDNDKQDTEDHTSSSIFPGKAFKVEMYEPTGDKAKPNQKSGKEMNAARNRGEATGVINKDFINIENQKIADRLGKKVEDLREDEKWTITHDISDLSTFSIKAPKNAKAGEFIAVSVDYTYTNGSKDTHWFHFVVQDSNNNRPEYPAEVGFQGDTLTNKPIIKPDPEPDPEKKKRLPKSYELIPQEGGYKDDKGNIWENVTIDKDTGVVTATVPENATIIGGENIFIPVKVNYQDKKSEQWSSEEVAAQFIARPKYKTTVTDTDDKLIPYETKEVIDETLPAGTIQVVTPGKPGKERTIFEQDVINGQKGLVDPATGQFTAGDQLFRKRTETIEEKQDRLVKVGVKPVEETVAIPRPVEVEVDPNMEPTAEPVVVEEGQDGVVTVKTTRDPQTGAVTITKATTKPAQPKKVKVGTKTTGKVVDTDEIPFKYTVEFDPDFYKNYPDATENYKVVTPGQAGSNKKTWTIENSKVVGEPVVETVAPVNAVIKVGQKDYTGSFETVDKDPIPYETEYIVDNTLEPGKEIVENPGALGEKTTTTIHTIQNGQVTASTPGQSLQTKVPVKRVVRIGAKSNGSHQVTEPIPFQVEVKKDPSLKKGEYKLETPGKSGSQTKTLTIENSQVTATSEPTINEQARNAVVLVGDQDFTGEVSHDVTEKVPFPVKVIEDPTLDKGTYHVDQEGIPGSKTTTYSQAIKNGTADGALTSTVKAESAPQEHIIRVGTKPLTGSTTVMTTNQKPFDVEIEYDNTKPAGSVEVVPNTGVPGEESKTTPVTAQDGTVTPGTTTTTETKAPVNKKIIVGTQGYNGEFSHEYTNVLPFETEVEVDPSLAPNAVVEVQKGQLGETTTKVTQSISNGVPGEKVVSDPVQTKAPVNRKIKVGAKTEGVHTYTEELPFSYTVEYDPAIEAGKYEIVTPGAVGSRTTEWPITNSVVGQGKVTQETPATNALIKIGNKDFTGQVTHTETVPVPNTVEIRYNPNVKAGETKVLEAGKPGSVDVTYSQAIKNGQADGELKKTEANRVEPVNRVIEVGTQPVSGTETPIQQDVPVEVEYLYDNTKDKGFVEAGQVTPGKTQSKVVSKVVDGQVVNTVENIVTPAKQQIIVGTKDYTGNFEYKDTDVIPNNTQVTINPNLAPNEVKVVEAGNTGLKERTVRQSFTNGKLGEQVLGDYTTVREPKDRVIEIGTKTDGTYTHKEALPFEVEVRKAPDLKKGQTRVLQEGQPGEQTTTVTIENSQVVGTPSVTTTKAPVKHIVEVGDQDFTGEVSHNVTETLPFKVEIQEDPTLPLFEIQEVQKGENGSKTTKYSQAIKNGAADGELKAEEIARTEPKTHIIKVGTKAPENAETRVKEVPAEIEYVYDKTKDKGTVEKGAYSPGKVESKIVNKFNPQTGKIETTTEEVVTPAKQVIVVGTKDYTGEFKHTEQSLAPFKTEYILDPSLKAGQEVVEQDGKLGLIEREVSQKYVNGTLADKVFGETREVIAPENRIVRIGAKTNGSHTSTEEIPFDVKVEVDPPLAKGEYRVITPGQPGSKETTVSIENSQIVGEPVSKVTKAPVTQVIKVGNQDFTGQVSHTERFEVPFKVEVRENPNLKVGETKLIQQGQPGSYDVTYTQAVKNGQSDGDLAKTITNPVEPKAHIVEVGTQPVAGTETAINKEIPVEVEYVFDDSLEKGQVETGQLTPGKTETKVVSKVVDGQVVNTEETLVTPAKQIVRVGSKDFTGDYKFSNTCPVPFPVEIKENPDLPAGTSKTVQEGVPGSKTTDYTQAIKNGQAEGAPVSQDGVYTAPKAHIIEVGTKPVVGNTHESNKDVPVETIFEYDPSLDKGKVETVQVVPGHVTTKLVNKVVNGQVVTEEVPVVTPAKHIVKVGTKDFTGSFTTVDKNPVPFEVEYKLDPSLAPGTEVVDQEGLVGEEETPITHTIVNGQVTESTPGETTQTKAPVKKIVRIGAKTDGSYTHTEEIPFKVVVEVDPSLNKGEYKLETPGQVGQKTTTVTIENSQVVGTPSAVVTKEPVTEVIKVGGKDFTGQVSHTEHFETAFKVIVRRNEALKPGQVKTVQEGVRGSYDVTFTQKIKNGQADGPLQADRHNEVAAVDHIIEVGPDCPICPVPGQPDQPGQDKPNTDKPNEDKPGDNTTPGGHIPDTGKPEKPGNNTPEEGNPETPQPGEPSPGRDTPENPRPSDDQPGHDKPGSQTSEDPQPGDKKPGQDTSEPDTPGGSSSNNLVPSKDPSDHTTPGNPIPGSGIEGDAVSTDKTSEGDASTGKLVSEDPTLDPASSASLSPASHKASSTASAQPVQVASVLPQTGAVASVTGVGLSLLLAGLGCLRLDRKKKD
ncbi:G5 domain-containing protein [Aerococcus mictus]|uniref:G5 domain-containing protein n=1 Tax=Aerococcus mictus TaxID=2976810 RepID=UPI0018A71743|nr:G5 domain-containing protein [Aerococcus mictus]